jgi:hypothetical protein
MASAGAQQALPLKVNCGDLNGDPVGEPGYLLLSEAGGPAGISLSPGPVDTVHVAALASDGTTPVPSDVYSVDPDQVGQRHLSTSLQLADGTALTITGLPPNRPFRMLLEMGASAPWADVVGTTWTLGPLTVSRDVLVEERVPGGPPSAWRPLVRNLRCAASYFSNSLASILGSVVPVWTLVHSDASGTLTLRFSTEGSDPLFLTGFELHEHEPLPVVYHMTGGQGPLVTQVPELQAFAAAFNAHDYSAAEGLALQLSDPFHRGVALTWLVGWLDGSRDESFDLIPAARSALQQAEAGHPAVPWLLAQLDQFRRALDHLDARGYTWARECPEEGGFGFLNKLCAGQVSGIIGKSDADVNAHIALRLLAGLCAPSLGTTVRDDIDQWNAQPLGYDGWEPSPLVFAALKHMGVSVILINPLLGESPGDADSAAFVQLFKDVFQLGLTGGGFETDHFPHDMELPLFLEFANQGQHPFEWDTATVEAALSEAQIAGSWWADEVALVEPDPTVVTWAPLQRDFRKLYRAAVEYWLTERLQGNELGGGPGDDVELMLQLYPLLAARQEQTDRRLLDGLDALSRHVLEDSGVVADGYYSEGLTDVQHSGEFTTNPYMVIRGVFGLTPRAVTTGLGVTRHLLDAGDPSAAWAAPTTLGRLHFKSTWFTADGPDEEPAHALDIPLNGRATFPGVGVGVLAPLAASHPLLADLGQLAAAWRDDALDTTGGKPKGFFGPVQWPSNVFGQGGLWWSANGSPSDPSVLDKGEASFVLELLRMSYHRSVAPDRWRLLLPAVRIFKAVQQWEDQGQPGASPGTQHWAAAAFRNGKRFHAEVISHLDTLESDPILTTQDDPDVAGSSPYVDAPLLDRMREWAEQTSLSNFNLAQRYALQPVSPCGAGSTNKPLGLVSFPYEVAVPYYRAVYPLLTRHAYHTDRVFLNRSGVLTQLLASHTGAGLTEGVPFEPVVRWSSRMQAPAELAISCNLLTYDGSAYSAFVHNFEALDVSVDLLLESGLMPGEYLVEVGAADKKCDVFPDGTTIVEQSVHKRGHGTAVPLSLPPGLSLVRITRQGPADLVPQARDLSVDPPRLEIHKLPGQPTLHFRARVANTGAVASPPATLRFHASIVLLDGSVLPLSPGPELLIASLGVPSLPATTDYTLVEHDVELVVPLTDIAVTVLLSGLGIQLRAELVGDGLESDTLNNDLSRSFFLSDIPVVPWDGT